MPIAFLNTIFPYDTFFMPLFIYISGYFYHDSNKKWFCFIKRKFKKLIIPFYFFNICVAILWFLICLDSPQILGVDSLGFIIEKQNIVRILANKLISESVIFGCPFDITSPGWFLISLFFVSCTFHYCLF